MYETQRQDFDLWARLHNRDMYDGAPKLQRDPLSRIAQMGQAVVRQYDDAEYGARMRQDAEQAYTAVQAVMNRLVTDDPDAYNCLLARHTGRFMDRKGAIWRREGLPEKRVAVAMFGSDAEAARKRFQRACIRGYIAYGTV